MQLIDKIAWIQIRDKKILSTRSKRKKVFYLPGGKREGLETDEATLIREIKEELNVIISPATIQYFGTFYAQAHGHSTGIDVKMTCYTADYQGALSPSSEIEEIAWLNFADRFETSAVDQIIFAHLLEKNLIE